MFRKLLLNCTARRALSNGFSAASRNPSPCSSQVSSHWSYLGARRFFSSSERPRVALAEQADAEQSDSAPSTISIDRTGLCNPMEHSHDPSSESELVKHLKGIIKFRGGPISVAEYMEEVLTNPKAGFYITRDVFGAEGDFITSPEVSQMFGEMICVWAMCLREQMGQPNDVNLVELGPGRGTLMADLLRLCM